MAYDRNSGVHVYGPQMMALPPMTSTTGTFTATVDSSNVQRGEYRVELQVFDAENNESNPYNINFNVI